SAARRRPGAGPRVRDGRAPWSRLSGDPHRRGSGRPGPGGQAAMRRASPIQRLPAVWGLIGLVPIAVLLFKADLTLLEAGGRALVVRVVVVRSNGHVST